MNALRKSKALGRLRSRQMAAAKAQRRRELQAEFNRGRIETDDDYPLRIETVPGPHTRSVVHLGPRPKSRFIEFHIPGDDPRYCLAVRFAAHLRHQMVHGACVQWYEWRLDGEAPAPAWRAM